MVVKTNRKVFFVSSPDFPFFPGTGGTEAFTLGMVRELRRQGVDSRIVTIAQRAADGRAQVPDIPFLDTPDEASLSSLDATLVGVVDPFSVRTKHPAFIMAHVPPASSAYKVENYQKAFKAGHTLIANSAYSRKLWAESLGIAVDHIPIVYPFAHQAFGLSKRTKRTGPTRVLFAGRLHIDKGIYLFLEALHHRQLQKGYHFTVTTAQGHDLQGQEILGLLRAHPRIHLESARTTPESMAELMAAHDIVVVPSNHFFWQEAFGMISVEAQHAGCRVIIADTGGLPETNVGALHCFEPGNSQALAQAIEVARTVGPVPEQLRKQAGQRFTVAQSAQALLDIIALQDK